ncbi:hypothetical protein EK21DRAFT_112156 [Setomelanomma holmii]|uniref:Uncharacterized protein n=1 Tax=Setomelanomma holmii TaxID=210430 RepID=A0A9P4H8I7_9PLEO|nr:hypothetical protein EK21DRAFT_112156 [Setomelanomma holmii]
MSTIEPQAASALLKLPGEIQNRSYEYCCIPRSTATLSPSSAKYKKRTKNSVPHGFFTPEAQRLVLEFNDNPDSVSVPDSPHQDDPDENFKDGSENNPEDDPEDTFEDYIMAFFRFMVPLTKDVAAHIVLWKLCLHKPKTAGLAGGKLLNLLKCHTKLPDFQVEWVEDSIPLSDEDKDNDEDSDEVDNYKELLSGKDAYDPPDDQNETWIECMRDILEEIWMEPSSSSWTRPRTRWRVDRIGST